LQISRVRNLDFSWGGTDVVSLLLGWILLACAVFVVVCGWRAIRYARAPVHLRWDLYPVAHEPHRDHGGSYLEEKDWWTKPRVTSRIGELTAMAEEILFLKGVWENNRAVWWGSLPFHWGLYLMILATLGIVVAALGFVPGIGLTILAMAGGVGGALTALGALILFVLRSTDRKLQLYTSPLDRLNLLLLVVLGLLSTLVILTPPGISQVTAATASLLRLQAPQVSTLLGAQMTLAGFFLCYMPFTRMVHFFSKYFTYHQVRWDDRPVQAGSALDRRLSAARQFGVSWSAEHVRTGKTWVEVVTRLPKAEGE
jgi:nitrate reductase gamma subunit